MQDVNNNLNFYGVKQIIIGHTIISKNITYYYSSKVPGIDMDHHNGNSGAIPWTKEIWHIQTAMGGSTPLTYKPVNDQLTDKDILQQMINTVAG